MNKLTRSARGILCLTGFLLGGTMLDNVQAQKVYESVDAEGDVTFSDTPPPSDAGTTRQIELQPGPTAAEVSENQQQLQNLENMSNQAGGADESQATQPAPAGMPADGESTEDEGNVYVEGGYADERYRDERLREGAAMDNRYPDERPRRDAPAREGHGEGRYGGESVREGGGARPAGRVR